MSLIVDLAVVTVCSGGVAAQPAGTGLLNVGRALHSATRLQDGRVLIAGGENAGGSLSAAELYDPNTRAFSLAGSLIASRADHTATLLADGRVLLVGGRDGAPLASTEVFDPITRTFSAGPALAHARAGHAATVLGDGRIMIAGGDGTGTAEIFDPATFRFTALAVSLTTPRRFAGTALLEDGTVLVAGGTDAGGTPVSSVEIFTPATGTFTAVSSALHVPRARPLLRVLPDGKVLVIGGRDDSTFEVYDPAGSAIRGDVPVLNASNTLADVLRSRTRAALIHLPGPHDPLLPTQLTPPLRPLLERTGHSLTELPEENHALVAGGTDHRHGFLRSAYLVASSGATITTDHSDYPPGSTVQIAGASWQPGESVRITIHQTWWPPRQASVADPDVAYSAVADETGTFMNTQFVLAADDVGRTFTVTAIGNASGFVAQTAFRDSTSTNVTTMSVQQIGPATVAPGTTGVPILGFTLHVANPDQAKRVRAYWNSVTPAGSVVQKVSLYRENGTASGFQANGPSADTLLVSTTLPNGQCGAEANLDLPDLRVPANSDVTFYVVVDLKSAAPPGAAVDFRVNADRLVFQSGTWPPVGQSTSDVAQTPCPKAANPWNPAGVTTVAARSRTTIGSVAPASSVVGQAYSLGVTVAAVAPAIGTPTGSVTVSDGAGGRCTIASLSSGSGNCAMTSTGAGAKTLTATYGGDATFSGSTGTAAHVVTAASTMTVVAVSANPSVFGQAITITATVSAVSPGSGTPDGTVDFMADGTTILSCGNAMLSNGSAACTTSALTAMGSPHAITAVYHGSGNYTPGSPGTLAGGQVVTKAGPAFSALSSPSLSYGTASTTLAGTISAGHAIPSGSVSITLNGFTQAATINATTGAFSSTFATGGLAVPGSPYAITYRYAGDTNFTAASDVSKALTVTRADQTLAWSNPADIVYGTALGAAQLNATVAVPGPEPAGALTYSPAAGTILAAGTGRTLSVTAAATANYNAASKTVSVDVLRAIPVITWAAPADFAYPTPLSGAQLNAAASINAHPVAGTFVYTPPAGTVLSVGNTQPLHVDFTPTDTVNFTTASKDVTINVVPGISVSITDPVASATVPAGMLLVRGAVQAGGAQVGIVVNGVAAAVDGTTYAALVPVTSAVTSLTAVATSGNSATASSSVTVSVSGTFEFALIVRPSPQSGAAPLTVTFSLSGAPVGAVIEFDFDGNGSVDLAGPTLDGQIFTYSHPGLYFPAARVTDASGTTTLVRTLVQVHDRVTLDATLQAQWTAVREGLRRGDIPGAAAVLHSDTRAAYQAQFALLSPTTLANVDQFMTTIDLVEIGSGGAQYEMLRTQDGQTLSFAVWFQVDQDGLWRLRRF